MYLGLEFITIQAINNFLNMIFNFLHNKKNTSQGVFFIREISEANVVKQQIVRILIL